MATACCLTEIVSGNMTAGELAKRFDTGNLSVSVKGIIDAKAVLDSVTADEVKTPSDKHLLVHAKAVREFMKRLALKSLSW